MENNIERKLEQTVEIGKNALKKIPFGIGDSIIKGIERQINHIEDTTDENIHFDINKERAYAEEQQQKLWAREDAIRRETQAREDTAYQRAVQDMQRAGINPNLMNVTPAESGGGITTATEKDYTTYEQAIERLMQEIDNNFTASENEKDRLKDLVKTVIQSGALIGAAAMKNK